jgi:hypothetical protein
MQLNERRLVKIEHLFGQKSHQKIKTDITRLPFRETAPPLRNFIEKELKFSRFS